MCADENEKLNKTKATGKMEIFSHSLLPSDRSLSTCDRPTELAAIFFCELNKKNHNQTTKVPFVFVSINKIITKTCHPQTKKLT